MSLFYRVLYAVGFTPWEEMVRLPIGRQIDALFGRLEEGREPPRGRVLDLGCGSGIWSVELARRGWDVTGIEIVPKALRAARRRARDAGVEIRFLHGDITELERLGPGSDFDLVLDFGAVHGLRPKEREAVGRGVNAVAARSATLLMLAFAPGRRGPLPRGMSAAEIEAVYPGWRIVEDLPQDVAGAPKAVRNAQPRWYRLQREQPPVEVGRTVAEDRPPAAL